ncbi:hypothetical protein BT96DRAFT_132719 [Gymnopus androsaceus JB14]|uniref:Uncharacterized protein n=1 Tax=Gymnopus androsaceus JB14 TaxID=1447944 RepID=A0A6A4ICC1_9AGAR|nr:hypothetical protein BT96DRAFT_132719 [Gymnopus androsaceus JB14]
MLIGQEPYLFIAPLKITERDTVTCFSFNDPPYFWSFDPKGHHIMKKETQTLLGLPIYSQTIGIDIVRTAQDESLYMAIADYIKCKRYNPSMQDCARGEGHWLFEVVDDNDDFEVVEHETSAKDNSDDFHPPKLICHCKSPKLHDTDCALPTVPRVTNSTRRLRRTRSLSAIKKNDIVSRPLLGRIKDLLSFSARGPFSLETINKIGNQHWRRLPYKFEYLDQCLDYLDY